ncbi:MAG: GntR family transcriptional regulator [Clostridia bacterium]|nr:GntR family transcriptional regulator [Clostridia bacterium]
MSWDFNSREAIFVQIANRLRCDIVCGKYPPDSQIPTVRQLAENAAVNPNTVQKALACLEDEGLLCAHTTVGRFVTSDVKLISAAKEKMRRDAVHRIVGEASALGISRDELIKYIKEDSDV